MNEGAQTSKVGFSLGGKCLAGTAMGFGGWGGTFRRRLGWYCEERKPSREDEWPRRWMGREKG